MITGTRWRLMIGVGLQSHSRAKPDQLVSEVFTNRVIHLSLVITLYLYARCGLGPGQVIRD